MFTALLDTSVLWPSLQRDFLLSMAAEGLYRPIWSQAILDELVRVEADKRVHRGAEPEQAEAAARRLVDQMGWAFDDSCVEGWEPLEGSYGLPDPDDEHLVAAAVVGGAGVIVSDNVKDLPAKLLPHGISVVTAARFAADSVSVSPEMARRALGRISARYVNPPRAIDDLLDLLSVRYGMAQAAAMIRDV
ncbi:PIN domain-containing protein [Myceligenerans pegani]|uniref:PIN domain-containing protein n=1 Tax=Myceligenerans pegani TaxID=2776917 RepID=A0ABR9N3Y6_9MICO|nr:PIN domain-containing protein [Myceligenerans sp. TRM 65318]MBE1878050.1 PIN domain-containing protein [Myceligenerans sp. TRM 65318]MBE3020321.1 PIN domain-containing protein [Myceligenerans sp. TRM 65318]